MIVARNLALLNNIAELHKKSLIATPKEITSEYYRLQKLGLVNTKNASIVKSKLDEINLKNEDIMKHNELIEFLKEMLEVFGHNILLVPFQILSRLLGNTILLVVY